MGNSKLKKPDKAPSKLSSVARNNWSFTITWKNPKNNTKGDHKWEQIYVRVTQDRSLNRDSDIKKGKVTVGTKNVKKKNGKTKKKKIKVNSSWAKRESTDRIKVFKRSPSSTSFTIGNSNDWLKRSNFYKGYITYNKKKKKPEYNSSNIKLESLVFEVQPWNKTKGLKKPSASGLTPGVPSAATSFYFTDPAFKGDQTIDIASKDDNHTITVKVDYDTSQKSHSEIQFAIWNLSVDFVYWDANEQIYKRKHKEIIPQYEKVVNANKFIKTKTINTNATIAGFGVANHSSVLDCTPGEGLSISSGVWLYGVHGDAYRGSHKNLAYPYPVEIKKDGIDTSDSYMYIIRFARSYRGSGGIYNSDKYVLEMLRNYRPDGSDTWDEQQWLKAAQTEDSGWKEVYSIGPNETSFCHNKQKAKPEKYSRTFYRIRSDNSSFDSIYSAPKMVPDYVSVPNPKAERVKFLEALATDDGKSIKITYGWKVTYNSNNEANSDGTEVSWSPDEYAWRSNQKPEVLNMLDEDFIDDSVKLDEFDDPEKRPSWAGDVSMGSVPLMIDMPPKSNVRYAIFWNKSDFVTESNGNIYVTGTDLYNQPSPATNGSFDWNNAQITVPFGTIKIPSNLTVSHTDKDAVVLDKIFLVFRVSELASPYYVVWQQYSDKVWKALHATSTSVIAFSDWSWDSTNDAVLAAFYAKVTGNTVSLLDYEAYGYPLPSDLAQKGDNNLIDKVGVVYLRGLSEGTPYYLKLRRSLTAGLEETAYSKIYAVYTGNTLDASDEIVPLSPSSKPTNLVLSGPEAIAEGDDLSVTWTFESTGEQTQWMLLYAKPNEDGDGEEKPIDITTESPLEEDIDVEKTGDEEYTETKKIIFSNPMPLFHTVGENAGKQYSDNDAKGYARIDYEDIENLLIDGKIYLAVRIQTTGSFVQSNIISISVSKAPTLDVLDFPSEVTKQPLSFSFRSSVPNLDVKMIIRAEASYVWKPDGPDQHVNNQVIYSEYLRANQGITWSEEYGDEENPEVITGYIGTYNLTAPLPLHDMGRYVFTAEGIDQETNLSTYYKIPDGEEPPEFAFDVNWEHQAVEPSNRSYILKNPKGLGVNIYIKSSPGMIDTDVCDIYRVTPDGAYLVLEGQPFDTMVTDMYAPFSNTAFTRYRLCTRTVDGDIAWNEVGYRLKETCIRLDWGGTVRNNPNTFDTGLSLPYNVRLSDSFEKNFESRLHMDGFYSGYWNSGIKRTASLSTDIIKVSDPEKKERLRALAHYTGPVYVRTPDGCAYTANVTVKTIPYEYNSQVMSIQLDATEIAMADEFMIERYPQEPFNTPIDEEESPIGQEDEG